MSHFVSHLSQLGHRIRGLVFALVALVVASVATSCVPFSEPYRCDADEDCVNSVCSRDGECALASELLSVRLAWTICAAQATAEACDAYGISGLRISFLDTDGGDDIFYEPVLCELGQIYFDRMSPRYDALDAALIHESGQVLDSGRFSVLERESVFQIDFSLQSPTDPLGCAMLRAP